MKKNRIIPLILICVLIIFLVGLIILKNTQKSAEEPPKDLPSESKTSQLYEELPDIIKFYNEISSLMNLENVDQNNTYISQDGKNTCYKIKDDEDLYSAKMLRIYAHPFSYNGYFEKTSQDGELYLCKPQKGCTPYIIDINNVKIIEEKEDTAKISIEDREYTLRKTEDVWKFDRPTQDMCIENRTTNS